MRKKCKYGKPFAVYGLWFVVLYGLGFLLFISCNEGKKQQTADKQQTTNDKLLTIDVNKLSSGIYYVKVRDEKNNLLTRKIVKM